MIDRSLDAPHTLIHRDFRVDNMHFDAGVPVVFDWGSVGHGGGLYDYAYFVAGSLDDRGPPGPRRRAAWPATGPAWRQPGSRPTTTPSGPWHDVGALFCLVVPILAGGSVLDTRDEKGDRLVAEMLRRLFSYLHDHDVGALPGLTRQRGLEDGHRHVHQQLPGLAGSSKSTTPSSAASGRTTVPTRPATGPRRAGGSRWPPW